MKGQGGMEEKGQAHTWKSRGRECCCKTLCDAVLQLRVWEREAVVRSGRRGGGEREERGEGGGGEE